MDKIKCRICKGVLSTVLDLGEMYISDFLSKDQEGIKAPLALGSCNDCGLIQLNYSFDIDTLYKEHYWYRSALNKSMLNDLKDIVIDIENRITLEYGDAIVDIGCNDGSLFDFYTNKEIFKIGFDPAPNLEVSAKEKCDFFINDYFYVDKNPGYTVKVITSIAMFYDLPDPHKFVSDIKKILDKKGIWVIQLTDLYSMLEVNAIDNICAEHLEYYRLIDIINLVENHGLQVFDISYNKVNGGSVRIFISHPRTFHDDNVQHGFRVSLDVDIEVEFEREFFIDNNLYNLYLKIMYYKRAIKSYMNSIYGDIYGLAASTKGNTLLQVLELDDTYIKAIGEINEDKFGLYTVGTNIPIMSEEEVLEKNPELIIVLAWHFKDTFDKVLKEYIENGGRVLYPLPMPRVYTNKGIIHL